ncbi:MAG: DUF1566 domain-containing protein [Methylococcales bacterium]
MNKTLLRLAVTSALMGVSCAHAASYDSTTHVITLNNVQGLNNNTPTFNTAVNLQASDNQALHKGQIFKIAKTSIAIGNPDASYTVEDNKVSIPNLAQEGTTLTNATLQLTNPATGEITVLDLVTTSLGTGTLPAGNAVGDMQYWNGTQWSIVPAGTNGAYLAFCDGKPAWGTCKATTAPIPSAGYKIGDTGPAGGKVFFVDSTFLHGLEAQSDDYNKHQALAWEAGNTVATTSYGDGWRLPTKDELNTLFQFRANVGGFSDGAYWSSTEYDTELAWYQIFINGSQTTIQKSNPCLVRAVRAF